MIPVEYLRIFTPDQFSLLLSGIPTIDVDDWQANTEVCMCVNSAFVCMCVRVCVRVYYETYIVVHIMLIDNSRTHFSCSTVHLQFNPPMSLFGSGHL